MQATIFMVNPEKPARYHMYCIDQTIYPSRTVHIWFAAVLVAIRKVDYILKTYKTAREEKREREKRKKQ